MRNRGYASGETEEEEESDDKGDPKMGDHSFIRFILRESKSITLDAYHFIGSQRSRVDEYGEAGIFSMDIRYFEMPAETESVTLLAVSGPKKIIGRKWNS